MQGLGGIWPRSAGRDRCRGSRRRRRWAARRAPRAWVRPAGFQNPVAAPDLGFMWLAPIRWWGRQGRAGAGSARWKGRRRGRRGRGGQSWRLR